MQIPRFQASLSGSPQAAAAGPGAAAQASSAARVSAEPSAEKASPDAEAANLQALLHKLPEVRPDVVAAARERLAQGDYLTRRAAEAAAEAWLHRE